MQAELQTMKGSFTDQERRLASLRAAASPSAAASPASPTPLKPHSPEAESALLRATTTAEKRAWLERYAALLRSCDEGKRVRAHLQVTDGARVRVHLDVVPVATTAYDRLNTSLQCSQQTGSCMNDVMQGHLHSMGDVMHGMMAIARHEIAVGGGGNSVHRITGGASAGDPGEQDIEAELRAMELSMASTPAGSSLQGLQSGDMAEKCQTMLHLLGQLEGSAARPPTTEVRSKDLRC